MALSSEPICDAVRASGAFSGARENGALIVERRVASRLPGGIFDSSSFEERAMRLRGVTFARATPNYAMMATLSFRNVRAMPKLPR